MWVQVQEKQPGTKKKKSTMVSSKNKSTVMSPIRRRMKKRNPSGGQNGQLVHWWLLIHSAPHPGLSNGTRSVARGTIVWKLSTWQPNRQMKTRGVSVTLSPCHFRDSQNVAKSLRLTLHRKLFATNPSPQRLSESTQKFIGFRYKIWHKHFGILKMPLKVCD